MSKVWFDFNSATNYDGSDPKKPKNTLTGFTAVAGDELMFRRGGTWTGALSFVAGLPEKRTKYLAWYNADGSDDQAQARPILNSSTVLSTFGSSNKDNIDMNSIDLRTTGIAVASDTYSFYCGNNFSVTNCVIDSNVGGIGVAGKSNIGIYFSTVKGVSYVGAQANNVIGITDNRNMDNIVLQGNTVGHKMGGGANCHGIRADCTTPTTALTNLVIDGNTVSPIGASYNTNQNAIGIRLQRCPGAVIKNNRVTGMLSGVTCVGGGTTTAIHVHHNFLNSNYHFGVHLTTDMLGFLIEYNDCSFNGTNISNGTLSAYGRGIEFSSSAGQSKCADHIVRFNVCNNNKNYGGPGDNASEGVGIGLDDSTSGCMVYGNIIKFNEGNGVQYYGGDMSNPAITDTGANMVIGNYLESNGTAAIKNRRTGGTFDTGFNCHINVSASYGRPCVVANNIMTGTTKCGISQNPLTTGLTIANNIFIDVPHAISYPAAGYGSFNNVFHSKTITVQKYCTNAVDGNGVPTFPTLAYSGTNDLTFDPLLNAKYEPTATSPAIGAGYMPGFFLDFNGKAFKNPPSIGMFENYPTPDKVLRP